MPLSDRKLYRARSGKIWIRLVMLICVMGVAGYVAYTAMGTMRQRESARQSQADTVAASGLTTAGAKHLDSKFTDKQGRLLADPPASPDKYLNPDTIVVAHIDGVDETPGMSWAAWEEILSRAIGKKVVDQTFTNSADEVVAAASGKVTLLALHPADAPFLVNTYGFQPLAVLGNDSGINGNRLDIIVPAASSIAAPADLKGHRLVCTVPSSITGYRAAIAVLMQQFNLRPNVDYEMTFSLGQKRSIKGVADKQYDCAAVSDEKLQSLVEDGTIKATDYKGIYQSPVIPRTTIGCFYNLNPALAAQLSKAILAPNPAATKPATDAKATALRFMPVDYKKDFQFVRTIDDLFDPRFDARKATHASGGE